MIHKINARHVHKINARHDNGSSINTSSQQLGVSRNTVRKHLRMDAAAIALQQGNTERCKRLDDCRDYIIHPLENTPRLSAFKVLRKLRAQHPLVEVSDRTARRY